MRNEEILHRAILAELRSVCRLFWVLTIVATAFFAYLLTTGSHPSDVELRIQIAFLSFAVVCAGVDLFVTRSFRISSIVAGGAK